MCSQVLERLAELYGKWRVLIPAFLAADTLAPRLARISDSSPIPLLAQGIVWIILLSAAMVGGQILPLTIIADATDADERVTGQRREGSFYSAQGLFGQIASMGAAAVLPLLLSVGSGPTATVGPMGVRLTGLVSGLALLIACAILWAGRPVNERGIRQ